MVGTEDTPQEEPRQDTVAAPSDLFKRLLPEEHRILIQELQVHQIELEMQNEELNRAQQELEASRADYFDLYNLAPVGYLTLSGRNLILDLNLTAATLVGMERGKLLNTPFPQLIHPEDQALYDHHHKQFEQDPPQPFEIRLLHRAGHAVWVNVQAAPARARSGAPVWRVTLSDITERKQTEAALFQSQKLESMGILAGGMAHDFNNLLASMLGNLELSALDEAEGAREQHLGVVQECVLRAAGLCRQMQAYAGQGRFLREPIWLDHLIQANLDFMNLSVAKGVDLQVELEPDLPAIEGDEAQIEQAIMNLVVNASESYGPEGGPVRIRVRRRTLQGADLPSLVTGSRVEPGPFVVLDVEDSGTGMDSATLKKIFDPFFTTKFIGRGLGLAALLGIMRVNGGAVQVRSRPGQGTCFSLWFPLAQAGQLPEALPPAAPAPPEEAIKGAGQVLVVDDDEQVRAVLHLFLRHLGFTVLEANDGEQAVRAYRQASGRIRLVLLDLTMPHMGGLEASRQILEEFPEARIVLMSGYVQDSLAGAPEGDRIGGFLKKPFLRSELEAVLAHCLG
jgi:PAS domain S-box-containing protein